MVVEVVVVVARCKRLLIESLPCRAHVVQGQVTCYNWNCLLLSHNSPPGGASHSSWQGSSCVRASAWVLAVMA